MAKNKIVYGDTVLLDLTADTITADKLAEGYTAHDMSGSPIVGTMTVQDASVRCLTKVLTYSSAVSTEQRIWTLAELEGLPFTNLSDYAFLSMTLAKTDTTHITNQILYCNSFYPYACYRSNGYVYAGVNFFHTNSTTVATNGRSATALAGLCNGFFQIKADGIYFTATTAYQFRGTYLFTLTAKLAS